MTDLQIKAVVAGIFFGIWPLLMNRSGLNGNVSSVVFAFGAALIILPFAFADLGSVTSARWSMMIGACVAAAIGLMSFNGMLSKATPQELGPLFVMMIVVQVLTPVLHKVIMSNGQVTLKQGLGFVAALIAGCLLA